MTDTAHRALSDQLDVACKLREKMLRLEYRLADVVKKGIGGVEHSSAQPDVVYGCAPLSPDAHDAVLRIVEADLAQQLAAAKAEYAAFTVTPDGEVTR